MLFIVPPLTICPRGKKKIKFWVRAKKTDKKQPRIRRSVYNQNLVKAQPRGLKYKKRKNEKPTPVIQHPRLLKHLLNYTLLQLIRFVQHH